MPYSIDQPLSLVDREDVAEAAAIVLSDERHLRASYELVGTEPLSSRELTAVIARESGRPVETIEISKEVVLAHLPHKSVADAYSSDCLERIFAYYSRHGLTGSTNVLGWLLGRKPTTFQEYIQRAMAQPA